MAANITEHFYRPKRSFGQGNIFRSVCHSVHRGGGLLQIFGGGGVGCLLQILGGGLLQIFGGGLQFSEYGQRSAGTHPTGMQSCYFRNSLHSV